MFIRRVFPDFVEDTANTTEAYLKNQAHYLSFARERDCPQYGRVLDFVVDEAADRITWAGRFEVPTLSQVRANAISAIREHSSPERELTASSFFDIRYVNITGNVALLHQDPQYNGGVVQAASQFNCLEFANPYMTPECGVAAYACDQTQGPVCAIACSGGAIMRNYYVVVDTDTGGIVETSPSAMNVEGAVRGQRKDRQVNTLRGLEIALKAKGIDAPWVVHNGYIEATSQGDVAKLGTVLTQSDEFCSLLRDELRIGVQHGVQCTAEPVIAQRPRQVVTQTYNSAIGIRYSRKCNADVWEPLARLVLEASYEATLWVAVANAARRHEASTSSPDYRVLLTLVGGGVFFNDPAWIIDAMKKARRRVLDTLQTEFGGKLPSGLRSLLCEIVHYRGIPCEYDELSTL